jgi:hypothetical protein
VWSPSRAGLRMTLDEAVAYALGEDA